MDEIIKNSLEKLYSLITFYGRFEECQKLMIPFTQIFDLKNDNPYNLTKEEANIIRIHIGLYNNGEPQNIEHISKLYDKSFTTIFKQIILIAQKLANNTNLIKERNELLREGVKSQRVKEKILNLDLDVLDISEQFVQELKAYNINTIKDLITIEPETMKTITEELCLEAFPLHIIECIHSIGLNFIEEIENEILNYKKQQEKRMKKIYKKQQKYIDNNN